ncbi:MAG TPA: hypothetical protein PK530_17290 [Anaerolineales bacterium]|nr:hypothetical protein [Anaerolineales bacterium]
MRVPYNLILDPPAPYLSVLVVNPYQPFSRISLEAKLDTGADLTALPESVIVNLALKQTAWLEVSGFAGTSMVPTYEAKVEVADYDIHLEIVGYSEEYALLGRDFLNHLRLLLDGPAQMLEVLE